MKKTKNTLLTDYSAMSNEDLMIQQAIDNLPNQKQRPPFRHSPIFNGRRFKKNGVTYELIGQFWDWFDVQGERRNLNSIRFTDGVTIFAMELQEFYTKVDI